MVSTASWPFRIHGAAQLALRCLLPVAATLLLAACGDMSGHFATAPVPAPQSPDLLPFGDPIRPLNSVDVGGGEVHINDLAIDDGVALMAADGGVYSVALSASDQVEVFAEEGYCELYRLDVRGADIAASGRGCRLRQMQWTGEQIAAGASYDSTGFVPGGVALIDRYVLVGTSGDGLEVREQSDLALVTSLTEFPNVVDVAAEGDIAVAVDREFGLVVIDVADPTAPEVRGSLDLVGGPQGVAFEQSRAYVAAGGSLVIVDVSDPDAPTVLAEVATEGVASRVAVDGPLVAVANWFDTRLYDVSDPTAPFLVGVEEAQQSSVSVGLEDGVLYVGDWDILRTYDIDRGVGGPDVSAPSVVSVYGGSGELRTSFRLENVGDRPLEASMACSDPRIAIVASVTVEAGGREIVELSMTTADDGDWSSECTITSNDPDEPTLDFLVDVNPVGLQVGDLAPAWTLPDLDGTQHSLSAHRGEVILLTLFSGL